jgi:hypothetical protein
LCWFNPGGKADSYFKFYKAHGSVKHNIGESYLRKTAYREFENPQPGVYMGEETNSSARQIPAYDGKNLNHQSNTLDPKFDKTEGILVSLLCDGGDITKPILIGEILSFS